MVARSLWSNTSLLDWKCLTTRCVQVAEECLKAGAEGAEVFPVDLSDIDALEQFAQDVLKKYSKVDVLVNNAGMMPKTDGASGKLSEGASSIMVHSKDHTAHACLTDGTGDIREWHKTLKLNTLAPMALTSMFSPGMAEQKVLRTFCHTRHTMSMTFVRELPTLAILCLAPAQDWQSALTF